MGIMFNEVWTEARVERLTVMWAGGHSCAAIAADLNCFPHCRDRGRSAVIGKVHRLKLPQPVGKHVNSANHCTRAEPIPASKALAFTPAPRSRPEPLPRRNPSNSIAAKIAIAEAEPGLPENLEEPAVGDGIQLIDLTDTTCRYPFGHPGMGRFYFCGAPGADMKQQRPYCQFHHLKAFTHATQDRRSASHGR